VIKTNRLAQRTLLFAAAAPFAIALAASPAFAAPADAPAGAEDEVEAVVVTGSLFRRTDVETPSPVTVVTNENLSRAGITTVSEAIRSISADGAGSIGTGFQSGFSAGGSAVSLRGLGVSSTLVVIDGLRSTNFPINDDGHNAYVDLNSIPFSLVERVEVLKDGASSTYGADAIGGVVNLIMKKQFKGIAGSFVAGQSDRGDADHLRGDLTIGFGDYDAKNWNFYVNGEYQRDGRVTSNSRGFPYNTQDLSRIGALDQNSADSTLTTATPSAVVTRVSQTDLNNPLTGGIATATTNPTVYNTLNLAGCPYGTYVQNTATASGVGCKYDLTDLYRQLQPLQERYSLNARLSVRLAPNVEGYITGSYSRSYVNIKDIPRAIRATQPFGGNPALAANNPGIALPVYVCSAGVNCSTASDRRLNPNNPYAAAYANDPANGAARVYYLFGDIPAGSFRTNEVYRFATGLQGDFDGDWNWKLDGVYTRDNLKITDLGYLNVAGLLKAINTGAYNFVTPSANTAEVRNQVSPAITTPSHSYMYSIDASITKKLAELPGGYLQIAVGGQVRKEKLENNNRNAKLDTYTLTTSSAFGEHTVSAAFFELDAPVHRMLDLTASGRYDHYSEGFSHFSPKFGAKFTPIRQFAIRGTYSKGFRAPTFAESGARSQFAGFSTFAPPAAFQQQHGGLVSGGNTNSYAQSYNLGSGVAGNPDLKPEKSRSFTAGFIVQPTSWFSATVDYYNVKKKDLIVAGPKIGDARNAYYSQTNSTAGCAAVAAVGPGYSCNLLDAIDPLFPNAMPRVLIINSPFVNANSAETEGLDFSATANVRLPHDVRWTSRAEVSWTMKYNLIPDGPNPVVQKYAGTMGPYELSSGNGTPRIRGNWQNTLEIGRATLSATAYYVGKIKGVAPDERPGRDCVVTNANGVQVGNIQYSSNVALAQQFCYVKRFISVDMNGSYEVRDGVNVFLNVGNVFDARAPIAPGAYSSAPNFLTSFHYAGLIGRTFKAGVRFSF
jgi:iron complex outermembrane receptor protein